MKINEEMRLVIAEDDALIAGLIQAELESLGFKIVGTAANGLQAVALTLDLRPDVVVMDVTMPGLDGIAAAGAIQERCPTPVVILTAHDDYQSLINAAISGVGAYVLKPPQARELERAITIACARHTDLEELRRLNVELAKALAEVKTLKGYLPICCGCKKIRDDQNYWKEVEVYITEHTDATFTHGICPKCAERYFPGVNLAGET